MRRRNVPCSPCSGGSSSSCSCCGIKEKLRILWDRTIGSILRINGISPDGDGDFTIEAGDNINITQVGTGNGLRIDTTGAISYYSAGDSYIDVDNNDLEISLVNPGATGGVALHDDLALVAGAVSDILDGTTTVPHAGDAQYLGSSTSNVGSNTKPIKIVNGQAVAIGDVLLKTPDNGSQESTGRLYLSSGRLIGSVRDNARNDITIDAYNPNTGTIARLTIAMRDNGGPRLLLEKWGASIDSNGNPYATTYYDGQIIAEFL